MKSRIGGKNETELNNPVYLVGVAMGVQINSTLSTQGGMQPLCFRGLGGAGEGIEL